MSDIKDIVEAFGDITKYVCQKTKTDMVMMVFKKGPGIGLTLAGSKDGFNENTVPFLKEAVKRIQEMIAAAESGNINLSTSSMDGYIYDTNKGEFKAVSRKEEPDPNQRN